MAFTTPIYDRTSTDATYAFYNQDSASELKGALNISDLNRIEDNIDYLSGLLNSYGYLNTISTHATWVQTDFLTVDEIDRIKQNVINIITAYHDYISNPDLVLEDIYLDYKDINDIELILYNTNMILELMINSFRYSGTFYSGEGIVL